MVIWNSGYLEYSATFLLESYKLSGSEDVVCMHKQKGGPSIHHYSKRYQLHTSWDPILNLKKSLSSPCIRKGDKVTNSLFKNTTE